MSDIAIRVENLSKRYKIGSRGTHADELRGRLAGAVTAPFRKLFSRNGESRVQSPESREQNEEPSTTNEATTTKHQAPGTKHDEPSTLWALKDVSFEVKRGEILGIIGRNGAGKSTLLKILSRITEPTTGRVEMKGRLAALLEVGTGFHPELTGRENVYLNGSILGMAKAEIDRQFDAIVDFAGVEKFIDTPVKRYSSGMHVRLGFAVAAHLKPENLIVDEVLAVGDLEFRTKCLGKMEGIAQSGRTVIFVSHNMTAIRSLATNAVLLEDGKIRVRGVPHDIVKHYTELASPVRQHGLKEFRPRPDAAAQLISLRLTDAQGETTVTTPCGTQSFLEIEYRINSANLRRTNIAVGIMAPSRDHIWISFDTDQEPELFRHRTPGHYRRRVPLPTHLLKPGEYCVGSSIGVSGEGPIDRRWDEPLSFQVAPLDLKSNMTSLDPDRPGILNCQVSWTSIGD